VCCGAGLPACVGRPDIRRLVGDDPDLTSTRSYLKSSAAPANPSAAAVGAEQRRTPRRRLAGTVRREHGPAEVLTGLTGTLALHRAVPARDPRLPTMEGWPAPTPTLVRDPVRGDTGVGSCRV
jgi:hypothetical protein